MGVLRNLTRSLLGTVVLGIAVADAVGAETNILGDLGSWRSFWHGVGTQNAGYETSRSCASIVKALDAAREGNFDLFCSLFLAVTPDRPPGQVKIWYEEWKASTQRYTYIIGQEALLESATGTNECAAVSIVPCSLKNPMEKAGGLTRPKADVVFARRTGNGWRLLAAVEDRTLSQIMLSRATPIVSRASDFSPQGISWEIQRFNEYFLEERQKRG